MHFDRIVLENAANESKKYIQATITGNMKYKFVGKLLSVTV